MDIPFTNISDEPSSPDGSKGNSVTFDVVDSKQSCKIPSKCTPDLEFKKWVETNIADESTYGSIAFRGIMKKSKAKFIRLSYETHSHLVYELMTKHWKVEKPSLLVSVTGGSKNFELDANISESFRDAIFKIARAPGAWVVTGGTHAGVVKHVGDALQESTAVCLGIAAWDTITDRGKLNPTSDNQSGQTFTYDVGSWLRKKGAYLDSNHTHFILVDNDQKRLNEQVHEVKFRIAFESYLVDEFKVPSAMLVLNGGLGTFVTVYEAVIGGAIAVPVVIVKGSGKVADLFADWIQRDNLDEIIADESKINEDLYNDLIDVLQLQEDDDKAEYYHKMLECMRRKILFSVVETDPETDINSAVIEALLTGDPREEGQKMTTFEKLRFALVWERPDIAKERIFSSMPEIEEGELNTLLIMALARGNVDFVRLLLFDYGVSIHKVLTPRVLEFLYGYQSHEKNFPFRMERRDYVQDDSWEEWKCIYQYSKKSAFAKGRCTLKKQVVVDKFFRAAMMSGSSRACSEIFSKHKIETSKYPFWELFIWAVLCNLPDMAHFLWPLGQDQMAKSLIAAKVFETLAADNASYDEEVTHMFLRSSSLFKDTAYELLNYCYRSNERKTIRLITTVLSHIPNMTCLDLAVYVTHFKFVAHTSVQCLLTDVWTGKIDKRQVSMSDYPKILSAIVFPPLINVWFKFHNVEEEANIADNDNGNRGPQDGEIDGSSSSISRSISHDNTKEKTKDNMSFKDFCNNINSFYFGTPIVGFVLHFVFLVLFLILYSGINLMAQKHNDKLSHWEILLVVIVGAHVIAELYQITQYYSESFRGMIFNWITDNYNKADLLNFTLFFVGLGLRFNESTEQHSHTLHSVNCGIWILRLLTDLNFSSTFGPYLEMIQKMAQDLVRFLLIFLIFILSYGVTSTSLLYPGAPHLDKFLTLFMRPWFHIYGEYFIEVHQEQESPNVTHFGTPRPNKYDEYVVWVFLGIYLIFTNILLLNIIIAVFNNTYADVQRNAIKIWKFRRYHLIEEYSKRVNVPPPLSLIPHFLLLIRWFFRICFGRKCCSMTARKEKRNWDLRRPEEGLKPQEREQLEDLEYQCAMKMYKSSRKGRKEGGVAQDGTMEAVSQDNMEAEDRERTRTCVRPKGEQFHANKSRKQSRIMSTITGPTGVGADSGMWKKAFKST